jgi:hypothetical protein
MCNSYVLPSHGYAHASDISVSLSDRVSGQRARLSYFLTGQNITLPGAMNKEELLLSKLWICSTICFIHFKCKSGSDNGLEQLDVAQ